MNSLGQIFTSDAFMPHGHCSLWNPTLVWLHAVSDYAIDMLDTEGRVATWTAGGERILGYPTEEVVGRHFSCFYPPDDVAGGALDRYLGRAADDGHVEYECRHVRKDGSQFLAGVAIAALRDESGEVATRHGIAEGLAFLEQPSTLSALATHVRRAIDGPMG